MLPSSFPAPLSPSCIAPKAPPSRESQDKKFHTYKNDLTGRFSGRYLKICGTAQLNYKICPSHPLKTQQPLKESWKALVAHLCSLTTSSGLEKKKNPDSLAILRNLCSPGLVPLMPQILHIETDCKIHTVDRSSLRASCPSLYGSVIVSAPSFCPESLN